MGRRWMLGLVMLWLVGSSHASLTCYNKSKKPVKFKGTGLIGGSVDVKADVKIVLNLIPLISSLLCTVKNEVSGGVSVVINLLAHPYIACVDVDAKVTLYACDKDGNIKGKPLCEPF